MIFKMTQRQSARFRKLLGWFVACLIPLLGLLYGLSSYIQAYVTPKQLLALSLSASQSIRLGAMVKASSIKIHSGYIEFIALGEDQIEVPVRFQGVLPNLFKEGRVMIAEGNYQQGVFKAKRILAKHDENYQPREVARE